jgi:hypothetical protein
MLGPTIGILQHLVKGHGGSVPTLAGRLAVGRLKSSELILGPQGGGPFLLQVSNDCEQRTSE